MIGSVVIPLLFNTSSIFFLWLVVLTGSSNGFLDNSSNVLIQKKLSPKVEGAIIIANGVDDVNVKKDILSAVEVVTGLATHKIQVFEKGEN